MGGDGESFQDILMRNAVKRICEVGTGFEQDDIANLAKFGLFRPDQLLSVDPVYRNEYISVSQAARGPRDFMLLSMSARELAYTIENERIESFDIVFSRGLVSVGNMVDNKDPLEWYLRSDSLVIDLARCLNRENTLSTLMFTARASGELLMVRQTALAQAGLAVIHHQRVCYQSSGERYWTKLFKRQLLKTNDFCCRSYGVQA